MLCSSGYLYTTECAMRRRLSFESLERRELLTGYTPQQLRHVYGYTQAWKEYGLAARGEGITIAVVDAFNDPRIVNDLNVFSKKYGLAKPNLTVANLDGPGNWAGLTGWDLEETLDVEVIHALLPRAHILLVEAFASDYGDLAYADSYAASQPGVVVVSNSWGGPEDSNQATFDGSFAHPGVVNLAATGDSASPVNWPASNPNVIAVGGTTLTKHHGQWQQCAWQDSTRGVSSSYPGRHVPDVSMIGGYPGFDVYDSSNAYGWINIWGTSLACPAFATVVGAVDSIRLARGERMLDTSTLMSEMYAQAGNTLVFQNTDDPFELGLGTPEVPGFIVAFA